MEMNYISDEAMERIRMANMEYEEALTKRFNVKFCKEHLSNLLIGSVNNVIKMFQDYGKMKDEIEYLNAENSALDKDNKEKKNEIDGLKEALEAANVSSGRNVKNKAFSGKMGG